MHEFWTEARPFPHWTRRIPLSVELSCDRHVRPEHEQQIQLVAAHPLASGPGTVRDDALETPPEGRERIGQRGDHGAVIGTPGGLEPADAESIKGDPADTGFIAQRCVKIGGHTDDKTAGGPSLL